jgi:hypothetical protein
MHRWLIGAYSFGAALAVAVAWFPSFMCRAGRAVLFVGLIRMIWQSRHDTARYSLLFYLPFLVGTNLIWMGLPLPVDTMTKAWADCLFLASTVILLSALHAYNALSLRAVLGTNPHSEQG